MTPRSTRKPITRRDQQRRAIKKLLKLKAIMERKTADRKKVKPKAKRPHRRRKGMLK